MTTAVRRLGAGLVLLLGSMTLLGPTAVATPRTASVATAQDPAVTFGLTPTQAKDQPFRANFDLKLTPGQEIRDSVRIRNLSSTQLKLNVYATDALNTENGSVDLLPTATSPKDIGRWITLERTDVTLASNDFLDIPFTLNVPAGTAPGDHTAGIVASYVGEASSGPGTSVTLDRRIGTRVLARVAGALSPKLVVSDLKTTWAGPMNPLGQGTLNATWRVTNAGNIRMGANQSVKVASPLGMPARTAHPDQIADLLPGNSVVQTAKVSGVLPTFRSSTKVTVAPVAVREGDSFPADITASAKAGNWTIPWAFLLLLVILGIGYKLWHRRRQQLDDVKAAELEAIVDARLGRPTATATAQSNGRP